MIEIKSFAFNPFVENTYVVYDETKEAVIIDPGCYEPQEREILKTFIASQDLKVVKLINTHCHIDHVLGNAFVKREYGVDFYMHKTDLQTLRSVEVYASSYGFQQYEAIEPDLFLDEGMQLAFGNSSMDILFVPGHAPGHIVFYDAETKQLIGGDVLFLNSIGRTDLPGGNHDQLIQNIREKLFVLPDETKVYPGHGDTTTIGYEKMHNPFCGINA